jgi:PIN domain nuclease of toxin-antitoxin system
MTRAAMRIDDPLPDIHKDPFDCMIVVQSILEEMPLLTKDGNIPKYGIEVIW